MALSYLDESTRVNSPSTGDSISVSCYVKPCGLLYKLPPAQRFNNRHLFSHGFGDWKIQDQEGSMVPGKESSLPGFPTAAVCYVLIWQLLEGR